MSLGKEIDSLAKWTAIGMILNSGLALIVFSQMAQVNSCNERLRTAFLYPGVLLSIAGGIALLISAIGSIVPRLVLLWRRYVK